MSPSPRSPGRLGMDESTPVHGPLFCNGAMVMVEPLTTVATLEEYLSNKWSELGLGGKESPGEQDDASDDNKASSKKKPRLYIGDKRLNPADTLVQALIAHVDRRPLRKESAVVDEQDRLLVEDLEEDAQSGSLASHVWGSTHILRYVLEDPVSPTKKGAPPADASVSFLGRADVPVKQHFAQRAKIAELEEKGPSTELLTILTLLGALHGVYKTVSSDAAEDASLYANLPEPHDFVSTPFASKFMRQLADPVAICSRSLAPWCRAAVLACPFLFPHEARRTMHSSCLLGMARALHFCYGRMETTGNEQMEVQIAAIPRRKVRIDRANLIVDAARVMNSFATSQALVEIEYVDEVGTGSGPTLEFYAQIVDQLRAHDPPLFRSSEFGMPLYFHPYPAAFYATPEGEKLVGLAKLLGQVVGKCIMDGRVIDLDVSLIALALTGNATERDFAVLDPAMHRSQEALRGLSDDDIGALQLPWTLPGYPAVELRPGGAESIVEAHELRDYIAAVAKWSMVDGVQPMLLAFRKAVFSVLPEAVAQLWTPAELAALLGANSGATADQYWTMDHFHTHILAQHGYTQDSAPFVALLERMAAFTSEERRGFLQFVTGAPALPVGGFAGLKPPLTVVKREIAKDAEDKPIPNDQVLPSVMTCANYLKLPEYSSADVLRDRLAFAVAEGKNAFLLS
jgi:E3 ubiquitin-protein ligase TRIP12